MGLAQEEGSDSNMRYSRFCEKVYAATVVLNLFVLVWGQPGESPGMLIDPESRFQRDRIVVGTVQTLTTGDLKVSSGATFLQGFRYWADCTNQQGGITVGTRKVQVELVYSDDEGSIAPVARHNCNAGSSTHVGSVQPGDSEKAVESYKSLWEEKGVHFIFGGGVLGADALLEGDI